MKSRKNTVISVVVVALLVIMAACASQSVPGGSAPSEGTSSESRSVAAETNSAPDTAGGDIEVGIVWRKFDDDFITGVRKAMEKELAIIGGITLDQQDGKDDTSEMNNKLDVILAKGYKSTIIMPFDVAGADSLLQKCKDADMPVVFFNTQPSPEALNGYDKAYYVGQQSAQGGEIQAKQVIDYWNNNKEKADKNGDGVFQIVVLRGPIGHPIADAYTAVYTEEFDKSGLPYEIVKLDVAEWFKQPALEKTTAWITQLGITGIEAIVANNDGMALGAMQAVMNNGWNMGNPDEYIPIFGSDATVEALEAMHNGTLQGTVFSDPGLQSRAMLHVVKALAEGREITTESLGLEDVYVEGKYVWCNYKEASMANYQEILDSLR